MAPELNGTNSKDEREARFNEAKINTVARDIGELAVLVDLTEVGGVRGVLSKFELGARKILNWPHARRALRSDGIVDQLRGTATPLPEHSVFHR